MSIFSRKELPEPVEGELSAYDPRTPIRDWGGEPFLLSDATTGVICFGATGSGKTSGPAKNLALGYLAEGFGGLVLCAKKEERRQWEEWAHLAQRWSPKHQSGDLIIIDKSAKHRFNFLDWEASRPGEGAGLTINIVSLLDEVAGAIARGAKSDSGGGDNKFFEDALHHMNSNLVELPLYAGVPVSLPLLRSIANSAPLSPDEAKSKTWLEGEGDCATIIRAADTRSALSADSDERDDFEECRNYWLLEWPALSDKTRSIIQLSFSMLVRPFLTRPLRQLFSSDTTIRPEDAFSGKVIIVDLPVQEYRLAGRVANLVWKYCMQVAIMRRTPPASKKQFLRPVFIWADECQNFVSPFDTEYQAVARSAAGCTVYLTQTRESIRRVLGDSDTTDSLLANLQAKFFCQNTGDTNEWASKSVFGEMWEEVESMNVNRSETGASSGMSTSERLRRFIDPARFTTLKRGGPHNDFRVECYLYNGGKIYETRELVQGRIKIVKRPYMLIEFKQG